MYKLRLGIVSQTPLIRFLKAPEGERREFMTLSQLKDGEYVYTIGGVSVMVKNLIDKFFSKQFTSKVYWYALNPNAPKRIRVHENFELVNVTHLPKTLKAYANFKERLWSNIHGMSSKKFSQAEYLGYLTYNWTMTKDVLEAGDEIDIFMIHDFQQLMVGAMIGPAKPTILRWHIPFIPEYFTPQIRKFIVSGLEGFDAVIVSTKRDLEGLIRAGYRGIAYQTYPHIDPQIWKRASRKKIEKFNTKYNINPDDFLILCVARMDNIKSQDTAIYAIAIVKKTIPNVKLMLVGDGSFTSSASGLGHSKGSIWRNKLLELIKKLKLEDNIILTGYLPPTELFKAYERSDLFVLPSVLEGFGLTVVEAWLYDKCTIVSRGAGVSELISDGMNGFTFPPKNYKELAERIVKCYKDEKLREENGKMGHAMAKQCYTSRIYPQTKHILLNTLKKTQR